MNRTLENWRTRRRRRIGAKHSWASREAATRLYSSSLRLAPRQQCALRGLAMLHLSRSARARSWRIWALAGAASAAAAGASLAEPSRPSPFSYPELDRGVRERRARESRLADYVATVSPMIASARAEMDRAARSGDRLALDRARHRFSALAARVQSESAALTWGDADGQRRRARFVETYGCVGWTDETLEAIVAHSPIVEVGAGRGQWQRALTRAGADVLAFDNLSAVPGAREAGAEASAEASASAPDAFVGDVRRGDERKLSSRWLRRQDRTLLVVYPEGDLMERCLRRYRGDVALFVGEGRGGVNGGASLFDLLEREWDVERVVPVRPFEGGYERLWVLRRKNHERVGGDTIVKTS